MRLFWLICLLAAPLPAQSTLEFAAETGIQPVRILLKGSGSVIVGVGSNTPNPVATIETATFGGASFPATFIALEKVPEAARNGVDTPLDAAFDSAGNLWIVGSTTSDDFNLINPIVPAKVPYRKTGFIVELDPTGAVIFATWLGGQGACTFLCGSEATAVAADRQGNVYIGGTTDESDFPTTSGAYLTTGPRVDSMGNAFYYSFVLKLSASGKLAYTTYLGTGSQTCLRNSFVCQKGLTIASRVDALAADDAGAVTVTESMSQGPGRITRLSPSGASAIWTTGTGIATGGILRLLLAPDSSGAVTVFGSAAPLLDPQDARAGNGPGALFVQKISSSGTAGAPLSLGGPVDDARPSGIALDASGNIWLDGTDSSAAGPLADATGAGPDFLLEIDTTASKPLSLVRFFRGAVSAGLAIDARQSKLIPGARSALLTVPASRTAAEPLLAGFANAASYEPNTGAYPGAFISLFGIGFHGAPETVIIGGVPAPVTYAGPSQINVQVPFEAIAGRVHLTLPAENITIQLPITRSLGIFTTDGIHAAAINQDGTVNSASNPAAAGSIVTLYGTGAVWPYGMPDGAVPTAAAPLNPEQNGFELTDLPAGIPQQLQYIGAAPGIVDGVFQMNVVVPAGVVVTQAAGWQVRLRSILQAGSTPLTSNTAGIYVR